ncbi:MAG: hypothetical protein JSR60_18820 [Proteobacteria bacterium]|nr:hypothetical protein [Pseudomonadota bacterium]
MSVRNSGPVEPDALLKQLQDLIYDFHALGRFDDARPHLLWLMEIAEQETLKPVR